MQTLYIKVRDESSIKLATKILKKASIIIYPTETAYGLGADVTNRQAVNKIYRAKKRPKDKRLSVIFGSINQVKKYVILNKSATKLCKNFMPGPLTLISDIKSVSPLKKKLKYSDLAWRISSSDWTKKLALKFGGPISATSANISGKETIYKFNEVKKIFDGKVDLIIDGGNLKPTIPSTIFDTRNNAVIREGPISKKKIHKVLKI